MKPKQILSLLIFCLYTITACKGINGGSHPVESSELLPFYGEIRFHLHDPDRDEPAVGAELQVTGLRLVEMVDSGKIQADSEGMIVVHQLMRGTVYYGDSPPSPTFTFIGDNFEEFTLTAAELGELGELDPYNHNGVDTVQYEGKDLPVYNIRIPIDLLESSSSVIFQEITM